MLVITASNNSLLHAGKQNKTKIRGEIRILDCEMCSSRLKKTFIEPSHLKVYLAGELFYNYFF